MTQLDKLVDVDDVMADPDELETIELEREDKPTIIVKHKPFTGYIKRKAENYSRKMAMRARKHDPDVGPQDPLAYEEYCFKELIVDSNLPDIPGKGLYTLRGKLWEDLCVLMGLYDHIMPGKAQEEVKERVKKSYTGEASETTQKTSESSTTSGGSNSESKESSDQSTSTQPESETLTVSAESSEPKQK